VLLVPALLSVTMHEFEELISMVGGAVIVMVPLGEIEGIM
jgi:hypothetical protein